ncbi:gliding motility lipoprotein GldH [Algoriphagus sp. CAU 1675]|uniref:gliding motility lipoprotein GldH n=1 Tax=Algoriphagus sp. CAU 1675 TaxID=3032597 RepID=UPI0023DA5087|nr:gliding motility lipoprotein GldH [Algoriphagus sp. CAU 1675]MDF2157366.1 gliding motility lipoprotein GldH [Algoriphagus sp. CAU 1675]
MNKLTGILFLGLLTLSISCSNDRLFEEFQFLPNQNWSNTDSLNFNLGTLEPSGKTSLIGLRFNESYPFSNFYLRVISKDSSGTVLENQLLNIPLFNSKSGEPLGKGFGSTYTKYDTLPFQFSPSTREIVLLQYMRQENLKGIEAAGIKILKN